MNLIVFDIDDTLTKSVIQHQQAFVNSMQEIGIIKINQNWKEYKHHTDSYILKKNYEKSFTGMCDLDVIRNIESKMVEILKKFDPIEEINLLTI